MEKSLWIACWLIVVPCATSFFNAPQLRLPPFILRRFPITNRIIPTRFTIGPFPPRTLEPINTIRPPFTIRPPPLFTPRTLPKSPPRPNVRYTHNVIVPKSFRIGARETVILNLYEYTSARVSAYLKDLPGRRSIFSQVPTRVLNSNQCREPIALDFVVNDNNLQVFRSKQRVEIVIEVRNSGSDFTETIPVLVNKKSGYLFIQTDRPIYRPLEYVEIRVYPLEQDMSPEKENLIRVTVRTPDGIGAHKITRRLPPLGFVETVYNIAENPIFGTWTVEAKYISKGYNTTELATFAIRRYVLPTFNVKIDMDKKFVLVTDRGISGYIRANYSYGEPVEGNYFLTMKLKKTPTSEPTEFYKVPGAGSYLVVAPFSGGEHFFDIPIGDLLDDLGPGETLDSLADNSASISIEATVNAGGIMESDIALDIPFLKTPYAIDISRTAKYYIPGLAYHLQADIRDVTDGKGKSGIPIRVRVGGSTTSTRVTTNDRGEVSTRLDFAGGGSHDLTLSTALNDIRELDQSRVTFTVSPYSSPSNSYLQINTPHDPARVGGSNYFLTFKYLPNPPKQIRYIVLARGNVVTSGTNTPNLGSSESTQLLTIIQSMVPSARVVAYYKVGQELVSASIWFDVVDRCKDELTVEAPVEVLPGADVPFILRGAPQTLVGLSGVDKAAYFLHEQSRITRDSMFNKMDSFDRGCVRSGGSNVKDVFTGAGLQLHGVSAPNPSSPACSSPSRRRRKRNVGVSPSELAKKLAQCERDGKRENLAGEDCERRGRRCRENFEDQYPGCWKRFRDACYQARFERRMKERQGINGTGNQAEAEASVEERRTAYQDQSSPWTVTVTEGAEEPETSPAEAARERGPPPFPAPKLPPTDGFVRPAVRPPPISGNQFLAQGGESGFFFQSLKPVPTRRSTTTTTTTATTPITGLRRSDFRESLSWPTIQIERNGENRFRKRARDSITTFVIDAVGMHDSADGFCVAPSTELRVFKDIFVQINTPYALKKQEQADLRIIVFNYNNDRAQDVVVRVRTDENYCTLFSPNRWSELIRMRVEAGDSGATSLSVFPLKIPDREQRGTIEVEVRTPGNVLLDSIKKEVLIEPEGEIKDTFQSYPIDLKSTNQDSFVINLRFPEEFVPDTRQCWLYGYTNFLGPSIEVDEITKEPRDIKSIFRMPYGCGEQNMLVTAPNTYAHKYLTAVNKLPRGSSQYEQSIRRMKDGFDRELRYRSERVNRRAWAVFAHYLPSTWLNAFVDKVFIQASNYYTDMDTTAICNSLEWLLGEQEEDGNFREQQRPLHREMHGAVGGKLSLTAYVLITLVDAEGVCSEELTSSIRVSRNRAVAYLQANRNNVAFQRPYGLALLSYALSLHNPRSRFATDTNGMLLRHKSHTSDRRQIFWQGRPHSDIAGTDLHAYWYNRRPEAVDVETTAYALLAQIEFIKAKSAVEQTDLDLTRKIALWLISQRNEGGAFISTQDTVIGLQALATYQIWINEVEPQAAVSSMQITLDSGDSGSWRGPNSRYTFMLDQRNEGFRREVEVPKDVMLGGNVTVNAQGRGEGVLSYRCIYRTVVDEDACHFEIEHDEAVLKQDPLTIKLTITVSKPRGSPAEMAIIEVGMMSGFAAVTRSVDRLAVPAVVDGTVERYEINQQKVVLYVNKIGRDQISLAFLIEQKIVVEQPQPVKINVYDYYEPSVHCGAFYSLPGDLATIRTANCKTGRDEHCKCAEGVCPICRTRQEQLDNTTCLTSYGAHCEICGGDEYCMNMFDKGCRSNFVYVVNITSSPDVTPSTVFVTIAGIVDEIWKIGDDYAQKNSERTFITRNDCYDLCKDPALVNPENAGTPLAGKFLRYNTQILIMGDAPEVGGFDRNGNPWSRYRLTNGAILERIIPQRVCARAETNIRRRKLQCDNPNHPRRPKQEARCIRMKKIREACMNMRRLKAYLIEGCG